MQLRNSTTDFGIVAQGLHWIIVALVIVQFSLGWLADDLPISMRRLVLLSRHKSFGMTLFMLMMLRLGWRLYSPPPPLPEGMPRLQRQAAKANHGLLYGLLFALPIVGWLSSSASNLTVSYFGLFTWPDLVAADEALAQTLKVVHRILGWILLAGIGLHVFAAVWHQFWRHDTVLLRMLPLPRRWRKRLAK